MTTATIKAEFQCEIEKVWNIVTSLNNYYWRSDIDKIVVINPPKTSKNIQKTDTLQDLDAIHFSVRDDHIVKKDYCTYNSRN